MFINFCLFGIAGCIAALVYLMEKEELALRKSEKSESIHKR